MARKDRILAHFWHNSPAFAVVSEPLGETISVGTQGAAKDRQNLAGGPR